MTPPMPGTHPRVLAPIRARWWALLVAVGCALASPLAASDASYADGAAAFDRGDYATARALWRPLAEAGNARAQFGMGLLHQSERDGVAADVDEALRWYRLAARQGVPAAQNNLAILYADGRGVAADPALAVHYWRQAAESGYASAQWNLAVALDRGVGAASDAGEAARWYREAALQGVAEARQALAGMYREGRGVEQNESEARRWEEMATESATTSEPDPAARTDAADAGPSPVESSAAASELAPPPLPEPPRASPSARCLYLQLASLPTREGAVTTARRLAAKYDELLAGLQPALRRAPLGARGTWYRVVAGPICEVGRAAKLCRDIRARARPDACLVVSR